MRPPKLARTAAEIEVWRLARVELLGIGDGVIRSRAGAPVYGEGPPPEPDGEFTQFQLDWRRRIFAVTLEIGS